MKTHYLLTLVVSVAAAGPAYAAVTVIGSSEARMCYEAAEGEGPTDHKDWASCDRALAEGSLSSRDIVATHVNRGILKLRAGDFAAASADFDRAIAGDPDEPEAYLNKGVVLMRQNSAGAALPLFTMALEKRTRRPELALYGRGIANEELGNVRSAYADYTAAVRAAPKWKEPQAELARFRVRK